MSRDVPALPCGVFMVRTGTGLEVPETALAGIGRRCCLHVRRPLTVVVVTNGGQL